MKIKTNKELGYVNLTLKEQTVSTSGDVITITGYANLAYDANGDMLGDRDGEVVIPQGIDLKNFNNNPIMLFNHDTDSIIGNFSDVQITSSGLQVTGEVHKALNQEVFDAVKAGVLKTFSIGFKGLEGTWTEDYSLFLFTKIELYEISIVSIPAAPGSIFTTVKSACGAECFSKQAKFVSEDIKKSIDDKPKDIKEYKMDEAELQALKQEITESVIKSLKDADLESKDADLESKDADLESKDADLESKDADLESKDADITFVDYIKTVDISEDNIEDVIGAMYGLKDKIDTFIESELGDE